MLNWILEYSEASLIILDTINAWYDPDFYLNHALIAMDMNQRARRVETLAKQHMQNRNIECVEPSSITLNVV